MVCNYLSALSHILAADTAPDDCRDKLSGRSDDCSKHPCVGTVFSKGCSTLSESTQAHLFKTLDTRWQPLRHAREEMIGRNSSIVSTM